MKFRKVKNRSDRKKLRDDIGALQLILLKLQRGDKDEITGTPAKGLGRFHILRVASHPRLEFEPLNILLVNWMPTHFNWHHAGPNDPKNLKTLERIKEIRGIDYEIALKKIEVTKQKHDTLYFEALKLYFKGEVRQYKEV